MKKKEALSDAEILRRNAEEQLERMRALANKGSSESDILKLNHELAVHQIELEMQNKELLAAKEDLEIVLEKYTGLYDFAPTGYMTLSKEGEIIELNFYISRLLGKDRRNLLKNTFDLFVANESKMTFKHFLDEIFMSQTRQTCEVTISREGNSFIVYIIGFLNKNEKYADLNLIDITERKEAEEKLKKVLDDFTVANKELQQSIQLNADKDLFISVLAHDLRNPFGVLLGYTELLSENISNLKIHEIRKYVNEINKSSHDTYSLLEDLLKWSRVRTGKVPFELQKFNFINICREVIEILRPNALKKNIKISCSSNEEIDFMADAEMIKAVFRNLISNAIKFTECDGIISISARKTDGNIVFTVSDNGIGIEPERLPKLFDIAQFHTTPGTGNETGTGLGLLLCKEFIEKHGGKIWVESHVGKGSTFYFNIPYHSGMSTKNIVPDSFAESNIRKLKILIADDDAALRLVLSNLLREFCKEMLFAGNGVEAVDLFRNNQDVDLILMDYHMPKMNGYEAANQIRAISSKVIIIVETADNYSELIEHSPREGINDYFFKPYNKDFLIKLMKKYFSKQTD